MAYTTPGAISAWMGRVFTAEEYAYALVAADSATAFIDGALARTWPGAGTITNELYPLLGSLLWPSPALLFWASVWAPFLPRFDPFLPSGGPPAFSTAWVI